MNTIIEQIQKSIEVKQLLLSDAQLIDQIEKAAQVITKAVQKGCKTMLAGNGGSAADAQHLSAELVNKFNFDRPGIASIALTTDTSIMTAIANDYGYDKLFERQILAQGVEGDVFIGISTSGDSQNIIKAFMACQEKGIFSIGFTGKKGGKMEALCNICIKVPSEETPRIQEAHILIGHIICCLVEENLFGHFRHLPIKPDNQ